jgi:hypothetical protein
VGIEEEMISIVTTFRPFIGHNGIIQRNALRSWRKFIPDLEIVIAGEDVDIAEEVNASVVEVKCSGYGTPLLSSLLEILENTNGDIRVLMSGDIILLPDFYTAMKCLKFDQFFAVGRRWDIDINEELDDESKLRAYKGTLHGVFGIDYMVSSPNLWKIEVPPLTFGRAYDDVWMLNNAINRNIPTIDLTLSVTALHQNHDHNHIPNGDLDNCIETNINKTIYNFIYKDFKGTNSTTYYMENGEILRR